MKTYKKMPKIVSMNRKDQILYSHPGIIFIFLLALSIRVDGAIEPVFVWKFNQSSGVVAIESETGHDGIILGSPQWVDRPVDNDADNKALRFDGINDYVSVPNHNLINIGGPWSSKTIVVIFKADDTSIANKQILYEQGGNIRGLNIYIENGRLYAGGWNQNTSESNWSGEWASTPIESDVWYEVALVLRKTTDIVSSNKLELWLNEELKATAAGGKLYSHSGNIGIGNINQWTEFLDGESNDNKFFQGQIDEIRLYNDVLFAIRVESTSLAFAETVGLANTSSISTYLPPNLDSDYSPNEVIIKIVDNSLISNPEQSNGANFTSSLSLNQLFEELSVSQVTSVFGTHLGSLGSFYRLQFDLDQTLSDVIEALVEHELIELAQPNYIYRQKLVPNDIKYSSQWGLPQVNATAGWDYETGSSNSIVVAIIDSGIDHNHADLTTNIWKNLGEIPENEIDDDGNGYTDDVYGWDFHSIPEDNQPDEGEHGTHVAGIVGAISNNNQGIAGVMWSCQLMAVRVLGDQGSSDEGGYTSNIAKGITYAVNNGANIINMSLGADSNDFTLKEAIDYAYSQGVVLVAAAGNDNTTIETYPAAYGNVISVGATDTNDSRANFSNYGSWVDIVAPGVDIFSTVNGFDGYGNKSGTSMSTPFVSGLAGLILAKNPLLSPNQVTNTIRQSADQIEWMTGEFIGRINIESALKYQGNILIFNDSNEGLNISSISLDSGNNWLAPSISSTSIPSGGSVSVGLSLILGGMNTGTYTDQLIIQSNNSLPSHSFIDVLLELQNASPVITSLTADTNPLLENQTTNLSIVAHDSDNHTLTFDWSASQGQLSSTSGQSVTYTPPDVDQNIAVAITVTVTDGYGGTDTETMVLNIQMVDININPDLFVGFNLLAFPIDFNINHTAHSLLNEITNARSIMKWKADTQSWSQSFKVASNNLGEDFNIQSNRGYLIEIEEPTEWSVTGDPIVTPATLQLKAGLNLISIPYPTSLTASGVLSTIPNGQVLTSWESSTQSWRSVFKTDGTVQGNDFPLHGDRGYFIGVTQDVSWTPTTLNAPAVVHHTQTALNQILPSGNINTIHHLTVGNLTASSATLVFRTDKVGQSQLKWRSINDKVWYTKTIEQVSRRQNHYLNLSNLKPNHTYLVQAEVFDQKKQIKRSKIINFTTTPISTGQPKVIFGQVLYPNGQPKVDELVILTEKKAQLMISKTDKNGYWNLNLGNMKTLTGQAFIDPNEVYISLLGSNKIYRKVVKDLMIQQSSTMYSDRDETNQVTKQVQPNETKAGQNYPNPFNPETWIPFQLHAPSTVYIEIYNSIGNIVRRLELGYLPTGLYHNKKRSGYWDGLDQTGKPVASGIYFYILKANGYQEGRKMVVLK